jgi:hypothetical protein
MERLIEDERGRKLLVEHIAQQQLPFRVSIKDGRSRSLDQNALMWKWIGEIAEHRGDVTAQEVACELKLTYGIPLLCSEDEAFAAMWLVPEVTLSHEAKLKLMEFLPITSAMTMKQLSQYLDEIYRWYTMCGVKLTTPEDMKWKTPS